MTDLKITAKTDAAINQLKDIRIQLLKEFPETSSDFIESLLLRALNDVSVFTTSTTFGAGYNVVRLEIALDSVLVFEIVATALRAAN